MKNKKMLLFAGVLAAFLMLAVPFTVVSIDADDLDASNVSETVDWGLFTGNQDDVTITINGTVTVSKPIVLGNGDKILNINGKIEYTGNTEGLFVRYGDDPASLTINASKGAEIDSKAMIVRTFAKINDKDFNASNFDLSINGGTYKGTYAITCYSDVCTNNDVNVSISNATINADYGLWCGRGGPETVSISNTTINAKSLGLYLGSVNNVDLNNVTVNSEGTGIELKSGNLNIYDSTIIGGEFVNNVASVGSSASGAAVAPIVINNYYCKEAVADGVSVTIDDDTVIGFTVSIEESSPMVIVAAGQTADKTQIYPIDVEWKDAEYLAGYAANAVNDDSDEVAKFESNNSSIIVNGFTLVDDADKLDKALEAGNNVRLLNDINAANGVTFEIKKSLIVDGSGYKISSNGPKNNAANFKLFDIILADGEVTIENLTLNLAGGNLSRTLNINNADGLIVNVVDSTIHNGTHYAINITGSNKDIELNLIRTDLTMMDSKVKGYCAIQTWSDNAVINISGSTIYGNNTQEGENNSFAAIVVNQNCKADITIKDSTIITQETDHVHAPEYSICYKGESSGTLRLIGDVRFESKYGSVPPMIVLSTGGEENCERLDEGRGYFTHSVANIVIDGTVTELNSLNLPVGCTFTMEPGSVFSGTINGPEDASIAFEDVMAGNDGIVITAGSLSINGSMMPSGITSGTITLSGDDVFISGTVESGVTINVAPGCEPTIVDSLTFKDGSSLDFLGTGGKFSEDSGDVYYNAGSNIDGDVKSEDQKINASTGASYEKVTVFLKTNGPMYPDQSSVEVFVGDYYVDTLNNVQFDGPAGYIFEGWYTEFGLKITDLTKANNSITTLVANFVYDPSSAPVSPGAPGSAEPEESSEFDIADHVVLIEAVIAVLVLIGFVAYIRKN